MDWFDLPYARDHWVVEGGRPAFKAPEVETMRDYPEVIGADANTEKEGYLSSSVRIDLSRGVFYFIRVN